MLKNHTARKKCKHRKNLLSNVKTRTKISNISPPGTDPDGVREREREKRDREREGEKEKSKRSHKIVCSVCNCKVSLKWHGARKQ